ncbi:MAG: type II toxin-antitoxin system HicB family antitoxin [Clostridiales bacterium]|nr:type II toxin-antitoxin system HicB family antitoxin [Clostridiales bacterium]
MNNVLEYKGYYGTVEFSAVDNVLFGQVVGINSLISFESDSIQSLKDDFEGAVDDYLEMCAENNIEPEKVYRGNFKVMRNELSQSCGRNPSNTVE